MMFVVGKGLPKGVLFLYLKMKTSAEKSADASYLELDTGEPCPELLEQVAPSLNHFPSYLEEIAFKDGNDDLGTRVQNVSVNGNISLQDVEKLRTNIVQLRLLHEEIVCHQAANGSDNKGKSESLHRANEITLKTVIGTLSVRSCGVCAMCVKPIADTIPKISHMNTSYFLKMRINIYVCDVDELLYVKPKLLDTRGGDLFKRVIITPCTLIIPLYII